jgi:hypothetical protein
MNRNRTAHFHMGDDYACVMLEGQTTESALVILTGSSEEKQYYGSLIETAINDSVSLRRHGVHPPSMRLFPALYDKFRI